MANGTLSNVRELIGELSPQGTLSGDIGIPPYILRDETDPVFTESPAYEITDNDIANWNNKSDFSGSYNDLTNKPTIPTVPTDVSDFNNDAGYISEETDPTVPSWAKQENKPTYTATEVGALPYDTPIPTKTSDLINDSDFVTSDDASLVSWEQIADSGTVIASISINGIETDVYAPSGGGDVSDVQINSTSIVSDGVAEIPTADYNTFGVAKIGYMANSPVEYYLKIDTGQTGYHYPYKVPLIDSNERIKAFYLPEATTTTKGAMSKTDKTKLDGISTGANSVSWTQDVSTGTKIGSISIDGTSTDVYAPNGGGGTVTDVQVDGTSVVSGSVASIDLTGKVDKVTGKGLSENDFTDTLKNKLDGIASGAQANTVEGVTITGIYPTQTLNITNKMVQLPVFTSPTTSTKGAVGVVPAPVKLEETNDSHRSALMSDGSFRKISIDTNYSSNEDKFYINLNTGYDSQSVHVFKSEVAKATTTSAGVMSKDDKTKLDGIATGAEVNVQANWNETNTSSDAYIQNKPTIPTVPTNVSAFTNDAGYITSAHEVPSGGTAGQVLAKNSGTDYDLVWTTVSGGGSVSDVQVDGTSVVSGGVASIDLTGKVNKSGDTMTGNLSFSHGNGTVFNYQAGDVSKEVSLKITGAYSDGTGTYPVVGFTDITDNKRVILRNLRNPTSESEAVTLGYFTANTFSGSYNDLRNKPSIPSKTSDLTNDSGYLTSSTVPEEIFVAIYGTTTYADVLAAYNAGKAIFCKNGDTIVPLTNYSSQTFNFYYSLLGTGKRMSVDSSSVWGSGSLFYVNTSRTINGKALSSNITLTTSDLTNDSGYLTLATLPIYDGSVT